MKNRRFSKIFAALVISAATLFSLTGCGAVIAEKLESVRSETAASVAEKPQSSSQAEREEAPASSQSPENAVSETGEASSAAEPAVESAAILTTVSATSGGVLDGSELFSNRDLTQTPDLSEAVTYDVSGSDLSITQAGVYVLTGSARNVTITVDAGDEDKVQLVLDGVSVENEDFPVIYVKNADKVFVTTTDSENSLSVTGSFTADGDTNTDGVIFSRDDLVLNGLGTLTITSTDNGVVAKDDLKITGGTYRITAQSKCFEANDSIRVAGGTFDLTAGTDALHTENDDDDTLGYLYICGGDFTIDAGDDGIHATSIVQIDGGSFQISAAEGIEGTYLQFNDGDITIESWDDGINAAQKSNAYRPTVEINGGEITVVMGQGDTDGIDSNGDIYVNGGAVTVTGQSSFDYDGSAEYNGGIIIVNGQQIDYIPNQMMGGGRGGFGGGFGGRGR